MPAVIINPLIRDETDEQGMVKVSYCQNCGAVVVYRRWPLRVTSEQACDEDTDLFMAHLDTHYEPVSAGADN